jgi:hypothetical protein
MEKHIISVYRAYIILVPLSKWQLANGHNFQWILLFLSKKWKDLWGLIKSTCTSIRVEHLHLRFLFGFQNIFLLGSKNMEAVFSWATAPLENIKKRIFLFILKKFLGSYLALDVQVENLDVDVLTGAIRIGQEMPLNIDVYCLHTCFFLTVLFELLFLPRVIIELIHLVF